MGFARPATSASRVKLARSWLMLPNPNGRPNSDVVSTDAATAVTLHGRWADRWVIDFGTAMPRPRRRFSRFHSQYLVSSVQPVRANEHPRSHGELLVASWRDSPGLRTSAFRLIALHRHCRDCQTSLFRLASRRCCARAQACGHRPHRRRRRFGILHPASTYCGRCDSAPIAFEDRPALHADHLLRNLPLPRRPDAARHRPRRRSGLAAVPGRRRSSPKTSPPPPAA